MTTAPCQPGPPENRRKDRGAVREREHLDLLHKAGAPEKALGEPSLNVAQRKRRCPPSVRNEDRPLRPTRWSSGARRRVDRWGAPRVRRAGLAGGDRGVRARSGKRGPHVPISSALALLDGRSPRSRSPHAAAVQESVRHCGAALNGRSRAHAEGGRPGPCTQRVSRLPTCPPAEAMQVGGGDLGGKRSKSLRSQVPAPMSPGGTRGGPQLLPDRSGTVADGLSRLPINGRPLRAIRDRRDWRGSGGL